MKPKNCSKCGSELYHLGKGDYCAKCKKFQPESGITIMSVKEVSPEMLKKEGAFKPESGCRKAITEGNYAIQTLLCGDIYNKNIVLCSECQNPNNSENLKGNLTAQSHPSQRDGSKTDGKDSCCYSKSSGSGAQSPDSEHITFIKREEKIRKEGMKAIREQGKKYFKPASDAQRFKDGIFKALTEKDDDFEDLREAERYYNER